MGEIADALRRASAGSGEPRPKVPSDPGTPANTPDSDYSRAAEVAKNSPAEPSYEEKLRAENSADLRPGEASATSETNPYDVAVPRDRRDNWMARAVIADGDGAQAESYRHFAIRVSTELQRRGGKSVMILSALRHEGKTTTACNLALAYASMAGGRNTALLDLDLRRPTVARALGIEPRVGFEALLSGDAELDDVRLRTDLPSLDIYPTAHPLLEPHRELAHPRVGGIFQELERRYDTIVIDTAPLLLVPDAELLFPHVSAAVAVMRSRKTRLDAFKSLIGMLPAGKLLGTFVNDARPSRHAQQYGYYSEERKHQKPRKSHRNLDQSGTAE